ncbi:Protein of unknown function [Gryllus bimaculatus]|nr:Protein of unknown function [Gryllus bimaculatus]
MILRHLRDQCKTSTQYRKFSSIAIQYEQQNVSKAVQYEHECLSRGTQCNITTESRGIQCSLDNTRVLFENYNSQSNSLQYISKSTQWSSDDTSISTSSQSCDDHTKGNSSTNNSKYTTRSYLQSKSNEFPKEDATSTLHMHSLNLEGSQMIGKDFNTKQTRRLKSGKKNLSASILFGSIIRQRKNTYASSTTSGITEMFSSRSGLESVEDNAVSVDLPVQAVKPKKKHLWSGNDSVISISASECSLDFSELYPETQKTFPKCKWKSSRTLSIQPRSKYTYDEELTIIEYISEKKVYKQVGGVAMWQCMETEIKTNRTWQSLKEHFRKKILPNIDEFNLPKKVEESFHRINMR